MSEELKKDIVRCTERMREEGYKGESAADFASGYLHEWPELAELLNVIAGQ